MGRLAAALLAAACLVVVTRGEYLAENPFSVAGRSFFRGASANSTCSPMTVLASLAPYGPVEENRTCSVINDVASLINTSETAEWLSSPGDSNVELTLSFGQSELEIAWLSMEFTTPLPEVMTVETVNATGGRNPLQVLVANTALCSSYPGFPCVLFSNVTTTSNTSIQLSWRATLGNTVDVGSAAYVDLTVASGVVFTMTGYDEALTSATTEQYYGVASVDVVASCNCNGHSRSPSDVFEDRCICLQCQHNTEGENCEQCASGFNFTLWRRSTSDCPFGCQSDQCNVGGALRDAMCLESIPDQCACRSNIQGPFCDMSMPGFYVRSLHSVMVEGESALVTENFSDTPMRPIAFGSNATLFPGFSGRGYAHHIKPASSSHTLQWSVVVPRAAQYKVVFRYNNGDLRGIFGLLSASRQSAELQSTSIGVGFCSDPPCYSQAGMPFSLDVGFLYNIQFRLESSSSADIELLIDTVILLPMEFEAPSLLGVDSALFSSQCQVSMNGLGIGGNISESDSVFCQAQVFALSAFFFNGAFPCGCDVDVSNGTVCEPIGGQCPCYSPAPNNTLSISRDCSQCPFYYYGASTGGCQMCDCVPENNLCDDQTGQCVCPTGVTGRTCDQCQPLKFGYDPVNGCMDCVCNMTGSQICNPGDGTCVCKAMVTGTECDRCESTAFGFSESGCTDCGCNPLGSTVVNCTQNLGICDCKSSVQGDRCDTCRDGSFYLSNTTSGCLSCFCSGFEANCTEFTGSYASVGILGSFGADLSQWVLIDAASMESISQAPTLVHSETNSSTYLTIAARDLNQPTNSSLYWAVPPSEIASRDWLRSYGGSLDFTLSIEGASDMAEVLLLSPLLVLQHSLAPQPTASPTNYVVPFRESEWSMRLGSGGVTRDQFLSVLANLESIHITALNADSTVGSLMSFGFQYAMGPMGMALPIESCFCPVGYSGLSCESCEAGFYRRNGTCEPCSCNDRSTTCVDNTGICDACTDNTSGDSCEVCAGGFFDVNFNVSSTLLCRPCGCVASTSVSNLCTAIGNGQPRCDCNRGYNGPLCNVCADGFQGTPPGTACFSCECNGNIDPAQPGSCNQTTGDCLLCLHNTSGVQCERCANGSFGNAVAQQCQECTCLHPLGSVDNVCDHSSGACSCRTGVTGQNCDRCQNGTWNLQSGAGCEDCACDVLGSENAMCDQDTGNCTCRSGVTGMQCSSCAEAYFGLSVAGCSLCGCDVTGSYNTSCAQDSGQCFCKPGVVGLQCDMCQAFFTNLTVSGCENCGECVQRLSDLLTETDSSIQSLTASLANLAGLRAADTGGLANISTASSEVSILISNANSSLDRLYDRYNSLYATTLAEDSLLGQLYTALIGLQTLSSNAAALSEARLAEVSNTDSDVSLILGGLLEQYSAVASINTNVQAWEASVSAMLQNITAISQQIMIISFSNESAIFNNGYSYIQSVLAVAETAVVMADAQYDQTRQQEEDLGREGVQLRAAVDQLGRLAQVVANLEIIANDVQVTSANLYPTLDQLVSTLSQLQNSIANSTLSLSGVELLQVDLNSTLMMLQQALGLSSPNTGPADGLLVQAVSNVETSLAQLVNYLSAVEVSVRMAEQHAADIQDAGTNVDRILAPSLSVGYRVRQILTDYQQVVVNVEVAANLSRAANMTAHHAMNRAVQLISAGHLDQARLLYQATLDLQTNLLALERMARQAILQGEAAQLEGTRAASLASQIRQYDDDLRALVDSLNATLANATVQLNQNLESTAAGASCVNTTYQRTQSAVSTIQADTSDAEGIIDNVKTVLSNASAVVSEARVLVDQTRMEFNQRVALFDNISREANESDVRYQSTVSTLSSLQSRLSAIQTVASRLSVAVRLDGNTTLSYQTNTTLSNFATVSLFFLPSSAQQGTLLTAPTPNGQPLSISLSPSAVSFTYPVSLTSYETLQLGLMFRVDTWYRLLACQDVGVVGNGSTLRLSVLAIPDGLQWTASRQIPAYQTGFASSSTVLLGGSVNESFAGCVDSVSVNNNPLSLLSPDSSSAYAQPCGPRPAVEPTRQFESGVWFQGGGYAEAALSAMLTDNVTASLWFRTFSSHGTLMHIRGATNDAQTFTVAMSKGMVRMQFSISGLDQCVATTSGVYNDGNWHRVYASFAGVTCTVNLDQGTEQVSGQSSMVITMESINLGPGVSVGGSVLTGSLEFAGCIRSVVVSGESVSLDEGSVGSHSMVSFAGCPADVVSGVRFMGTGLAAFTVLGEPAVTVSFMFKTEQLIGVLLEIRPLQVSLYHTHVRVQFGDVVLQTARPGFADNRWHYVRVIVNPEYLEVSVDGVTAVEMAALDQTLAQNSTVFVGGSESWANAQVMDSFRGCLRNLSVNDRLVDFSTAQRLTNVALYGCRPQADIEVPPTTSISSPSPSPSPSPSLSPSVSTVDSTSSVVDIFSTSMIEDTPSSIVEESSTSVAVTDVFSSDLEITPTSSFMSDSSSLFVDTSSSLIPETSAIVSPSDSAEITPTSFLMDTATASTIAITTTAEVFSSDIEETITFSMTEVVATSVESTSVAVEVSSSSSVVVFESSTEITPSEVPSSVVSTSSSVVSSVVSTSLSDVSSVVSTSSSDVSSVVSTSSSDVSSVVSTSSSDVSSVVSTSLSDVSSVVSTSSSDVSSIVSTSSSDVSSVVSTSSSDVSSVLSTSSSDVSSVVSTSSLVVSPSPSPTLPLLPPPPPLPPPSQSPLPSSTVVSSPIASPSSITASDSSALPSTSGTSILESSAPVSSVVVSETAARTTSEVLPSPSIALTTTTTGSSSPVEVTPTISDILNTVSSSMTASQVVLSSILEDTPTPSEIISSSESVLRSTTPEESTSPEITPTSNVSAFFTTTATIATTSTAVEPSSVVDETTFVPSITESTSATTSTSSSSTVEDTFSMVDTTSSSVAATETESSSIEETTLVFVSTTSVLASPDTSSMVDTTSSSVAATETESSSIEETTLVFVSTTSVLPSVTESSSSLPIISSTSLVVETTPLETSDSMVATSMVSSAPVETTPVPSVSPSPSPTPLSPGLMGEFGSYLLYNLPVAGMLKAKFNIALTFSAYSSDGLLLYVGNGSDFFALDLRGGHLQFSYFLGGEKIILESKDGYSDGRSHHVVIERDGVDGTITVDGSDVRSGKAGGRLNGLDVYNLPLFVGGVPVGTDLRRLLPRGAVNRPSFVGCFSSLTVNGYDFDPMAPDLSSGSQGCPSAPIDNVATFSGTGYVQLMDSWTPGRYFQLSLQFRTTVCSGLLFYLANTDPASSSMDFVSLELMNGEIWFTFDNGAGAVSVRSPLMGDANLCSNQWVTVVVTKDGSLADLLVNEVITRMESSEFAFMTIDAAHPLYIGGVHPDVTFQQQSPRFNGCIRNISLTNYGKLIAPLFVQSSASESVAFGTCGPASL